MMTIFSDMMLRHLTSYNISYNNNETRNVLYINNTKMLLFLVEQKKYVLFHQRCCQKLVRKHGLFAIVSQLPVCNYFHVVCSQLQRYVYLFSCHYVFVEKASQISLILLYQQRSIHNFVIKRAKNLITGVSIEM